MGEFEGMIEQGGFVEHAKFGGNRYGTSRKMIEEMQQRGRVVVLDIEMEVCLFSWYYGKPRPGEERKRGGGGEGRGCLIECWIGHEGHEVFILVPDPNLESRGIVL